MEEVVADVALSVSGRAESHQYKWGAGCGGVEGAGNFNLKRIGKGLTLRMSKRIIQSSHQFRGDTTSRYLP